LNSEAINKISHYDEENLSEEEEKSLKILRSNLKQIFPSQFENIISSSDDSSEGLKRIKSDMSQDIKWEKLKQ
jgi:hypothetical protein